MFEVVRSTRQQKKFERTWEFICKKQSWENDPYGKNAIRYNLLLPAAFSLWGKRGIGTVEFIPYDPSNPDSTVEGRVPFSIHKDIMHYQTRTWEIDKLCLDEHYQRKGHFSEFMHIFYHHAETYKPKYYLALIEKKLYRMLKISYGLAIEQRGEPLLGPGTSLLPIVIDVEKALDDKTVLQKLDL